MTSPYKIALAELWDLLERGAPTSQEASGALRTFLAQRPFELLVATVEGRFTADLGTPDAFAISKFVAEPADLLLEVIAAARAAEWEKIIVIVHRALALSEPATT